MSYPYLPYHGCLGWCDQPVALAYRHEKLCHCTSNVSSCLFASLAKLCQCGFPCVYSCVYLPGDWWCLCDGCAGVSSAPCLRLLGTMFLTASPQSAMSSFLSCSSHMDATINWLSALFLGHLQQTSQCSPLPSKVVGQTWLERPKECRYASLMAARPSWLRGYTLMAPAAGGAGPGLPCRAGPKTPEGPPAQPPPSQRPLQIWSAAAPTGLKDGPPPLAPHAAPARRAGSGALRRARPAPTGEGAAPYRQRGEGSGAGRSRAEPPAQPWQVVAPIAPPS